MCRMKVLSVDGSCPAHGNSRSKAAKSAAVASSRIPQIAAELQIARNDRPSNALRSEPERRNQANSGYIEADEKWTRKPIQYGCCSVKIGCQNGNKGTRTNHSSAEVSIAHGIATTASQAGCRSAVHFPSTPKNTSAQEMSAHWWNAIPMATAPADGSALRAQSRAGMAATDIQSTAASRPTLAAESW